MKELEGRKQRDVKPCLLCGQGIMHDGGFHFYEVSVQSFLVDTKAVMRQSGLEQMMDFNVAIAQALGPDVDIAKAPVEATVCWLCQPCALGKDGILAILAQTEENRNVNA